MNSKSTVAALAASVITETSIAVGVPVMWGQNDYGQMNHPNVGFRQINIASYFAVGIDSGGNLRRWSAPPTPEPFVPPSFVEGPFVQVRGRTSIIALRAGGEISIWATDQHGSSCGLNSPPPGPFVEVAAGAWHAAALRADGSIATWGCTFSPWNGDSVSAAPMGGPFRKIACGDFNTHAIRVDGSISSAGYSSDGANACPSGGSFTDIAAGWGHGIALRNDGSIAAWGRNVEGECNVPSGSFTAVAAGAAASMALRSDGDVVIWGKCANLESGQGWSACVAPPLGRVVQLTVSGAQAGVIVDEMPRCSDADIYRDFNVNGADLGILLSQWGPNTPLTESDLNRDGAVDGIDLGILLSFWGACP